MAATNPDSKRPRLNSWGSASSSPLHEFQTHPQSHPQHSPPGPGFWGEVKTPHHSIQHTLSHQRSHSVPSLPPGAGGKNVSHHHTQPHQGHSASPHVLGVPSGRSPQVPSGPNSNPNPGYQGYHQLQKSQGGIDGSSPAPTPPGNAPRTAIDQQQVQQLRSLTVSGHSSSQGNHPQYQQDSSYHAPQVLSQSSGDSRGSLAMDSISPGSTTTLAPGPSPILTAGGFSGGSAGLMSQHMQGPSPIGGQVNGGGMATSPVTTPTSAGGMVAGGLQGMGVVTTYPPRRKAIRAAQACDACRARKAKCDEGRPSCGFCKESQNPCVYREVPPPKQDRTLLQILERLGRVENLLDTLNSSGRTSEAPRSSDISSTATAMQKGVSTATDLTQTPGPTTQHSPQLYRPSPGPTPQSTASAPTNKASSLHQLTNNAPAEVLLEEDEQLTIPYKHTTAAHKLMRWPSIRKLIDEEFLRNEEYILDEEEKRGPLRVYGRGEGIDIAESWFKDMDEGDTGYIWDSGIGVDEVSDNIWGSGEDAHMEDSTDGTGYQQPRRQSGAHSEGSGLTTGGGLKVDHQTASRLLNSYLSNIHILHPVLDRSTITKMIFTFADHVASSPQVGSPTTPYSTTPGPPVGLGLGVNDGENGGMQSPGLHRRNSSASVKRKRSISTGVGSMQNQFPPISSQGSASGRTPPQRIPKTIHSALVLLVLALGAVCLHRRPVPGPLKPTSGSPPRNSTPSFKTSTSPFSASTPPYHHSYPQNTSNRQKGRESRNIDVIPGLAYFGKAVEITGALMGGNELENVQVGLLAGLYWSQLGRVLDSWKWISHACMCCQILVRMGQRNEMDKLRKDLVLRVFWSCLQLESDVLAELDLPPSGISRMEDSMDLPNSITSTIYDSQTKDDPLMWMYYLAQIALRKLLNRAHTTLYSKDKASLKSPQSLVIARELDYQLEQWKLHLPEPLRWDESDAPSSDINAARLRAKYFGARYIIHRPFVYSAMHGCGAASGTTFSSLSPASDMSQQGSPAATTPGHISGIRRPSAAGEDIVPVSLEASCRKCLDSAVQSTTAFHAFNPEENRPIITNIFGTAHAQFGNLLVLQAAYQSPALKNMITPQVLSDLIMKTTRWLRTLAPISSALRKDAQILENAASKLEFQLQRRPSHY